MGPTTGHPPTTTGKYIDLMNIINLEMNIKQYKTKYNYILQLGVAETSLQLMYAEEKSS